MAQPGGQMFQAAASHFPWDVSEGSLLALAPPAPTRCNHERSRTAPTLPPLFTRTQSSSPTRSSALPAFLRPQSTRSLSPERVLAFEAAQYKITQTPPEEQATKKMTSSAVDKLASWFDGSSEPVNISLIPSPTKEKLDPVAESGGMENFFSASEESVDPFTRRPQRNSTSNGPAPSGPSRFGFFRKATTVSPNSPNLGEEDELSQLDVREVLFPQGYPDNFSPASFKNLQLNAEGILRRFQHAHIEQQKSLKTLTATKVSQADELEAANTRGEHLKFQLEDMAQKAAEQEKAIVDLRGQLAIQRASLDSHLLHQRQSVRMVQNDDDTPEQQHESDPRSKWRRHRVSDISTSEDSEPGSSASSVVSIFSEPLSATPSTAISISSPVSKATISSDGGCSKCHGLGANEAWDVVGVMKLESAALKSRVSELENAQDEALDFLSGLKLD
ncbi:uncharacterized protein A1O9_03193 [Exophiala aquamarina CBS 119918]|uniref:Uncharacterized protein n=1 Tax=Exophiala aquamarina CBS 119918 TaxID=1182545 RepID=A0A072Q142_9EURO|nr:uncharacterized protein A1O9_03193 [Exophiala aquamarina CBS 119918]KEF61625.1 hypothetical protein A1O9_03193 [Exophiala aquamarina CBS 119918]